MDESELLHRCSLTRGALNHISFGGKKRIATVSTIEEEKTNTVRHKVKKSQPPDVY